MTQDMFQQYRRKQIAELRPYIEGDTLVGVSISREDLKAGSPKAGDMIARNPKNHADQWLVAAAYFTDNFEPITHAKQNEARGSAGVQMQYRYRNGEGGQYTAWRDGYGEVFIEMPGFETRIAPAPVVSHETAVGDTQAGLSRTDEPQGGWQTVPKEPTADMKRAVLDIGGPQALAYGLAAWETMLAAAPSQKGPGQ